jgi:dephospho-CoA kinase
MPCRVGLTGGLASGKSTVARLLAARGIPVIDADRVVHDLYAPGGRGSAAVAKLFGDEALDPSGAVDRDRLARAVLSESEAKRRLEAMIHPMVRETVDTWVDEHRGAALVVVEAALLVETGAWKLYDALTVVWCRRDQQLERAVERGMDRRRAMGLLDAQADLETRLEVAHVAIDNTGRPVELEARVECALGRLRTLCGMRGEPRTVC